VQDNIEEAPAVFLTNARLSKKSEVGSLFAEFGLRFDSTQEQYARVLATFAALPRESRCASLLIVNHGRYEPSAPWTRRSES
jgi:hypothetical protein